jgi:hypothetical protein
VKVDLNKLYEKKQLRKLQRSFGTNSNPICTMIEKE